ncbi:wax ester synthase/diacylglycerol acyltransferase 11-like isoform X3 [Rhododendron vialii]|uniref:wax ester synthase/diacylglycerol acyltransferase 11-like isoform X3 n=1 Tax=Rhododendron vialii TaxID=182163 RepID=UPI00265DEE93|nr:wax ester synthase/diacylglycerol acyltransferase 11-like isoform X3 [Rhododendron vialii]
MDQYHTEEEDEVLPEMPVSPTGQYFNSSALSLSILAVLESEIPLDDSQTLTLLKDVFLPINPRFSSIMVGDRNGVQKWKRVEVKLEDHINVPSFPAGLSPEFYDKYFNDYLSKISLDEFPQNKPLWEVHILKYTTSNAAGHIIFKLHHALGDGFSLMGALLSCLQRADNPSPPLTFPSHESSSTRNGKDNGILRGLGSVFTGVADTVLDFGSTFVKDGRTPIRSGEDGVEFRPNVITTVTFSLDRVKQIKAKLGFTINDVIMGVIFLGTRLYMQQSSSTKDDHNEQHGNTNTIALVVLNTRALGGYKIIEEMVKTKSEMPWGNHFTFLHVSIPKLIGGATDDQANLNPLRIVKEAHCIIKRKRNSAVVYLNAWMLAIWRKFRGPEATAQYFYNTMKNSSISMSNLIGPVEKMALAKHPIKGLYFTVIGSPESLAITIMSYIGELRITIRMEKGFMDPQKFNSCIEKAFDMIFKAAVQNTLPPNS